MGPFVIYEARYRTYCLWELNGQAFHQPFPGDRLVFFPVPLQSKFDDAIILHREIDPDLLLILNALSAELSDKYPFESQGTTFYVALCD